MLDDVAEVEGLVIGQVTTVQVVLDGGVSWARNGLERAEFAEVAAAATGHTYRCHSPCFSCRFLKESPIAPDPTRPGLPQFISHKRHLPIDSMPEGRQHFIQAPLRRLYDRTRHV